MSDRSDIDIGELPRRTAHAAYALLAWQRDYPYGPHTASEIALYDTEAISSISTGRALSHALKLGLADRWGAGLWSPTRLALELRPQLEDRFLSETDD